MKGKPAATLGSNHQCPMCNGIVLHIGGPITQGSPNVLINGKPAATIGSICTCIGPPDTVVTGNSTVLINGKPIACVGDMTAHGGIIVSGSSNVIIGSKGSQPTSVMSIDEIPFPEIKLKDRVGAIVSGNAKKLRQAKKNQQKIQNLAEQQGKKEEKEKKLPKMQGAIIFSNGYLSSSLQASINAMRDIDPDHPHPKKLRGFNFNYNNHIDPNDIYTAEELADYESMSEAEIEQDEKIKSKESSIKIPIQVQKTLNPAFSAFPHTEVIEVPLPRDVKNVEQFSKKDFHEVFHGYWNSVENEKEASNNYAYFFNAGKNQHFLNGSQGLGSNAAFRMDHGIAQGYNWAKQCWGILKKEHLDAKIEQYPEDEQFSPAYRPITIVMHSQGNASGVGFALGVMNYANKMGWNKMALNLVFLGVHQPQKLWGATYEKVMKDKVNGYFGDTTFIDTFSSQGKILQRKLLKVLEDPTKADLLIPFLIGNSIKLTACYFTFEEDKNIFKYLNGFANLYDPEHKKLLNKRGIYEHLNEITLFSDLAERSVQFTFSNDRGDMVIRDGDIPIIDSACSAKPDTSLYSIEYFEGKVSENVKNSNKEIIALENGGHVVVPAFAAIKRVHIKEENGKKVKEYWKDYRSIAIDWGNAKTKFTQLKRAYEKEKNRKLSLLDLFKLINPPAELAKRYVKNKLLVKAFRTMVFHYARLQTADLYAHFAPVGLILDNDLLTESDNFKDELGNTSVFDRITKKGEQKFYRLGYEDNYDKFKENNTTSEQQKKYIDNKQRRIEEKDFIKRSKNLLINTNIATTPYIEAVIENYVYKDTTNEGMLYVEPEPSEHLKEVYGNLFTNNNFYDIKQNIYKPKVKDNIPPIKKI